MPVGPAVSEITPSTLDFGQVETGEYKNLKVQVKNIGAEPMTITGFSSTNPNFSVAKISFPLTLTMLQQKFIDIKYESIDPGIENGVVTFLMDPLIAGTKDVQVSAESVVPLVISDFPYFEGFNGGLPAGWKNREIEGDGWFFPSLPYPYAFSFYVNDKERKSMMITPQFDLTDVVSATLALNHRVYGYDIGWYDRILMSTDKINWTIVQEYTVGWDPDGYRYEEFDITPAKSGGKFFLAFEINYPMLLPHIYEAVWEIDDIKVTVQNPPRNVTFVVEDEFGVQLNDAVITLDGVSNPAGNYVFEEIEPGTHNYSVALAGFVTGTGEVTVVKQDIVETVVLYPPVIISDFPWVEGFDTGLPNGWQNVVNEGNGWAFAANPYTHTYIYYFGDLQRKAMLVTPLLDLSGMEAATLGIFHRIYAYGAGWSHKILMSGDGVNWETITTFTEGFDPDINLYMEFEIPDAKSLGQVYLAFEVDYPMLPDYYEAVWEIVDVTVFEPIQYYDINFVVEDEGGNAMNDAVVTLNGIANPAGNYLFEEIETGTYNYTVEKYGYITATGQVTLVDQDVEEAVVLTPLGQFVALEEGWSLISSYQIVENPSLVSIFADPIQDNTMIIMLGKTGIFWPGQNINTIGEWNTYQGQKIKMSANDLAIFIGDMAENKTVNLLQGVSFLPVLSKTNVVASTIFNQIEGKMLFAFDLSDGLIYWPDGGIFTLETLEPGKAYLVSMLSAGSVTFEDSDGGSGYENPQPTELKNALWQVTKTGSTHIISIEATALEGVFETGDILAVFDSGNECVGMAQFSGENKNLGLVVYGDDFSTAAVDGLLENELMKFKIYKPASRTEMEANPVWDLTMPQNGAFAENGLSKITAFKVGALGVTEQNQTGLTVFPNPAKGEVFITIQGNEPARVEIIDQLGQVKLNHNFSQNENRLDTSPLQPGIYLIKVTGRNQLSYTQKLIIN